jgi:hypothetical protein
MPITFKKQIKTFMEKFTRKELEAIDDILKARTLIVRRNSAKIDKMRKAYEQFKKYIKQEENRLIKQDVEILIMHIERYKVYMEVLVKKKSKFLPYSEPDVKMYQGKADYMQKLITRLEELISELQSIKIKN